MRKLKVLAVISLAVLLLVGCSEQDIQDIFDEAWEETQKVKEERLSVLLFVSDPPYKIVHDGGFTYVTGKVLNTGEELIGFVQVKFVVYDKEGNQIGTAADTITSFQPGATWKFEACIFESDVGSVDFLGFDGW
ncbi:MAG: FxLYD domain-containing protein [Coprothermobacter sp.]|nr:FxLYD domain-containing protein [Coprothermobacter sp.]